MSQLDSGAERTASGRGGRPRDGATGAREAAAPETASVSESATPTESEVTTVADTAPTGPTRAERRRQRVELRAARSAEEQAAKAEDRARRAEERVAREAATRRRRLESKLSRRQARIATRAERRERRLGKAAAREEARAVRENIALEGRQVTRAERLEKRVARAEAAAQKDAAELERRRAEIAAVAAATPIDLPAAVSARERRRERRRDAALAREIDRALLDGLAPSDGPAREEESLEEYLARVEAPLLPRRSRRSRPRLPLPVRRRVGLAVLVVLIGGAAVLPWAAPQVPDLIADALPGHDSAGARVEDPPVSPSTDAFTGPVGIDQQAGPLAGVRLKSAGQPREVRVPRLHVDSEVVPISGQSGTLLPPSDPQLLGWWQEGRWPGAGQGTAVITGHTVHTGGGALDHLDELAVGDKLRVRTDNGWIQYVVRRSRIYSTEELAREADSVFRLDGLGRLVMITCDDWNGSSYDSNAVVVATPVIDEPFS